MKGKLVIFLLLINMSIIFMYASYYMMVQSSYNQEIMVKPISARLLDKKSSKRNFLVILNLNYFLINVILKNHIVYFA